MCSQSHSSQGVTRFYFTVSKRTTCATTTSAEPRGWYSTRACWLIAGGFIGQSIGEGRITEQPKVRVIFSKWDAMKLVRVVGRKRVRVMCIDKGYTFEFV